MKVAGCHTCLQNVGINGVIHFNGGCLGSIKYAGFPIFQPPNPTVPAGGNGLFTAANSNGIFISYFVPRAVNNTE
jgi:hypothetical protein